MEDFKISAESQAKYERNLKKKQPSFLDLIFCNECGETFNSKKEEKRHICGNPSNFMLDNSDAESDYSSEGMYIISKFLNSSRSSLRC